METYVDKKNNDYTIEAFKYTEEAKNSFDKIKSDEDIKVSLSALPEANLTIRNPGGKLILDTGGSLAEIEVGDYIAKRKGFGGYIVWKKEYFEKYYELK